MPDTEEVFEADRAEIDGVPVFWAEGPPPFSGALTFRVGRSDETAPSGGITHLVEHLALFSLGRQHFNYNGMVDHLRTLFHASGTQQEVARFLELVCRSLGELPLDRLETESRVLLTEASSREVDLVSDLLSRRYGMSGCGLMAYRELGLAWLDRDAVAAWAAGRFTADNAAVWLSGPPPDDLKLPLPRGIPMIPQAPEPLKLSYPAYLEEERRGVAMSMTGKRSADLSATLGILEQRAERELRRDRGITYHISSLRHALTTDQTHISIAADCLPENATAVTETLVRILDDLAARGPGEEELKDVVEQWRKVMIQRASAPGYLDYVSTEHLLGTPFRTQHELLARLRRVTPDSAAALFRPVLDTALLLIPPGVSLSPGRFRAHGRDHLPLKGKIHRPDREVSGSRPGARLVIGDEGVDILEGDQRVVVRFKECAAVMWGRSGLRVLVDLDGASIRLDPDYWKDGMDAVKFVDRRVPPDRFVPLSDERRLPGCPPLFFRPPFRADG